MKLYSILPFLLLLSPLCAMDYSEIDEKQLIQKVINTGPTFDDVRKNLRTLLRDAELTLPEQEDDLTNFAITSTTARYPYINELAIASLIRTQASGRFIQNKLTIDTPRFLSGYNAERAVSQMLYSICSVPLKTRIKGCSELSKWDPRCLESHHLKINDTTILNSKGAILSWHVTGGIISMDSLKTIDEMPIESDNVAFNTTVATNDGRLIVKKNIDDKAHAYSLSQNISHYCTVDYLSFMQPMTKCIAAFFYRELLTATPNDMIFLPKSIGQLKISRILSINQIGPSIIFARYFHGSLGSYGIHLNSFPIEEKSEFSSAQTIFDKPVESCKIVSIKENPQVATKYYINLLVKLKDQTELVSRFVSL